MNRDELSEQGMQLELRQETGGPRYYLDGKPLHAGDVLQFRRADGDWQAARYEYTWRRHEGTLNAYLICAGADGSEQAIPLDGLSLRWPPF